jgi:tripartite-type tricarboxylate transporter receptor subunit TctC
VEIPLTARRILLFLLTCACTAVAFATERTQESSAGAGYPKRPVRMLIGLPIGGSADTIARIVAIPLSTALGQQIVIDNRPGALGIRASQEVLRATPDGHTILFRSSFLSELRASVAGELPYDVARDFAPVSLIVKLPNVLLVNAALPAVSLRDFIAYARANPGKLNYGSSGIGSSSHLAMELLKKETRISLVHVPFATGGALQFSGALAVGEIHATFGNVPGALGALKTGKTRALAVTAPERVPQLADVPTMRESGVDLEITVWFGLLAPARVPTSVLEKLNAHVTKVLNSSDVRKQLMNLGADPAPTTRETFARFQQDEVARWSTVIRDTGAALH